MLDYLLENRTMIIYKHQLSDIIPVLIAAGINWFNVELFTGAPDYYGETDYARITL